MSIQFLSHWIKAPRLLGAISPSSSHLAHAMAAPALAADHVVELGAGTGAITKALAKQQARRPLVVFEQNVTMAQRLRLRFSHASVVSQYVHHRQDVFESLPGKTAVVSSLPFRSLPSDIAEPTIKLLCGFLIGHPDRFMVQYTYRMGEPFPVPAGLYWRRTGMVIRNLPPAHVWILRTQRLAGEEPG